MPGDTPIRIAAHGADLAGDTTAWTQEVEQRMERLPRMPGATVRDYAAQQGMQVDVALDKGMQEMATKFKEEGSEIYKKV